MAFYKKKEESICEECGLERVERKNVEELIESVQIMSKQLEIILEEVVKRDEVIDKLEEQMTSYVPSMVTTSPDRMDALVWGLSELSSRSSTLILA